MPWPSGSCVEGLACSYETAPRADQARRDHLQRPHLAAAARARGHRYALAPGYIVVDKLRRIELEDVTPALARKSGFAGVVDLLKVAKHGPGENVYLIEFHYEAEA